MWKMLRKVICALFIPYMQYFALFSKIQDYFGLVSNIHHHLHFFALLKSAHDLNGLFITNSARLVLKVLNILKSCDEVRQFNFF